MGWAFRYSPYVGAAFAVHLALADSANDMNDYELWAAQDTIAAKARTSRGTVGRTLATMVDDGLLDLLEERTGRGLTNRYRLLMPERPVVFEQSWLARISARSDDTSAESARSRRESARSRPTNPREPNSTANAVPLDESLLVDADSLKDSPSDFNRGGAAADAGREIQQLVATYVDDYRAVCAGHDPSREWRSIAGREARKALANGETPEHIAGCLYVIAQERKSPAVLPHMIADSHAGVPRRTR